MSGRSGCTRTPPIARYKIAGIPLITVTGFLTAAFLGFNLWHWFTNDLYAVNNSDSLWFMGIDVRGWRW